MSNKFIRITLFVTSVITGCSTNEAKVKSVQRKPVQAVRLYSQELNKSLRYPGYIESANVSNPGFTVPGRVQQVFYEEGAIVKKGQVLATLFPQTFEASLQSANATLNKGEADISRAKRLFERGSMTKAEYESSVLQYEQAKVASNIAAYNLAESRCYAAFDGMVTAKKIEKGSIIVPGTVAFQIVSLDMLIVFSVPQNDVAKFRIGQKVNVSVEAAHDILDAEVTKIIPAADLASRTFLIKARISNSSKNILPGMSADAILPGVISQKGFKVPAGVVSQAPSGDQYVFVLSGDTAIVRNVTIAGIVGDSVIITAGITDGEQMITNGIYGLKNKEIIQVNSH